jgi:hypothetical protein
MLTLLRNRIALFTLMRIRIKLPKIMRIRNPGYNQCHSQHLSQKDPPLPHHVPEEGAGGAVGHLHVMDGLLHLLPADPPAHAHVVC